MRSYDDIRYIHERAEKEIPRCCGNCEFNCGTVCAGGGKRTDNGEEIYGMPIEEAMLMFPNGCESFGYSYPAFEEFCKKISI